MKSVKIARMKYSELDLKGISNSLNEFLKNNSIAESTSIREEIERLEIRIKQLRQQLKVNSKVQPISTKVEHLDCFIRSGMSYTRTSEVLGVGKATLRSDIYDAVRIYGMLSRRHSNLNTDCRT